MSEQKQVLNNSKIMAGMTFLSRIFGMLRDLLVARLVGATRLGDVWSISFMIPNLFRRLIAEGAMTSAFVPILSDLSEHKQQEAAREFMRSVFSLILLASTLIASVMILTLPMTMPFLFKVLNPVGVTPSGTRFEDMVLPTRIMFPYLIFISLASICQGVLNVHNRFALSAATPILLNLSMISFGYLLRDWHGDPIWGLCVGVLLGGFLQFSTQWIHLYRLGFRIWPVFHFWGSRTAEAARLWFPTVFSAGIMQINIVVATVAAANLVPGSTLAITLSNRLIEFVLGVFTAALTTSLLPVLSRQRARNDMDAANKTLWSSLALITLVALPASVGLILAGPSLINLLFVGGRFDESGLTLTYLALIFHAMMLLPLSWYRIIGQSYYAFKRVKLAVYIAAFGALVNISGCFFFPHFFPPSLAHCGVVLANLVSACVLVLTSRIVIARTFNLVWPPHLNSELARMLLATIGILPFWLPISTRILPLPELVIRILLSVLAYVILVWALRVPSFRQLVSNK